MTLIATSGKNNIGFTDLIISRLLFANKFFFVFRSFRKVFKNYVPVLTHLIKHSYPIECTLRDGSRIAVKTERELWYLMLTYNKMLRGQEYGIELDFKNEEAIVTSKDNTARATILGCVNNGDLWGIFVKGQYSDLSVRDRTVIDVGANIADSSIYFALQGAKRVIALEPFPTNYQTGVRNVQQNNLNDKINLVMAGISSRSGKVRINSHHSNTLSFIEHSTATENSEVPLVTIAEIVDSYSVEPDSILKIDCEGCEYDIILSLDANYLKKFSGIILEYHYGYKDLRKKLVDSGFDVSYQRPTHWKQEKGNKSLYTGLIFASRPHNL